MKITKSKDEEIHLEFLDEQERLNFEQILLALNGWEDGLEFKFKE